MTSDCTGNASVMADRWLVFETSGRNGSVAVATGDRVRARELSEARRHARDLAGVVRELLDAEGWKPAELSGVMVSLGPGSYTGLRVGVMSAKTLAYAAGCPLIGVETFRAIGRRVPKGPANLDVIADAQQGRVYHQRFSWGEDGWDAGGPIAIGEFADWVRTIPDGAAVSGPAVVLHGAAIPATVIGMPGCYPDAESVYREGLRLKGADPWAVEPLYLRGSYAEEAVKSRQPSPDS